MRYLPLTPADRAEMLGVVGVSSVDDLFRDVPQTARRDGTVDLPNHLGELEVEQELRALAGRNRAAGDGLFFCGAGPIATMCRRRWTTSSSGRSS